VADERGGERSNRDRGGNAAIAGVAVVAALCCAALPILLGVGGGLSVAAALGLGLGGVAIVGGLVAALVVVWRRRA
jgi:hypothetical protein